MIKSPPGILQNNHTIISLIQRFIDIAMIALSLLVSISYYDQKWDMHYSVAAILAVFLFHFTSELDKLYISWRGLSLFTELKKTFVHWFVSASVIFLLVILLDTQYFLMESVRILWFALGSLFLVGYRILLRFVLSNLRRKGFNTRSVVIAGAGKLGCHLAKKVLTNSSLGMNFNGYYDDNTNLPDEAVKGQIQGNLEQLVADCKVGGIDRVYITLPMRAEVRMKWLIQELADTTASVYLVPDIFTFDLLNARNDVIDGIPTISIYDSPLNGSNAVVKRIGDILFASWILLLISPIMLVLSAAVKFTSKGPVFFKQKRYGIDGKSIEVWKFRSMTVMENGDKVTQATKNDSRLTPIGQFIRSTSLDELPQFINVIQGQMSIVGPRPHAVAHNEEYRKLVSGYMLRHKVKPGITGWAQINGWRGETDTLEKMQKRIEFDLDYIRNWSVLLDIKIIFMTVFKGFIDKNAY